MVAGAIAGSAVLGAGASIFGANKAAKAQQSAAEQNLEMQRAALALQRQMYEQGRSDLAPYRGAGEAALNPLLGLAGTRGDPAAVQAQLEQLPGYQFALGQGLRAAQQGATARGLGLSGAAMKGASQFATGLADQTYGNQFNRLLGLTQLGQSAAAGTAQMGQNMASQGSQSYGQMGQAYGNIGDAQAAYYNSIGAAGQNLAGSVPSALFYQKMLQTPQSPQNQQGLYGQQNYGTQVYGPSGVFGQPGAFGSIV